MIRRRGFTTSTPIVLGMLFVTIATQAFAQTPAAPPPSASPPGTESPAAPSTPGAEQPAAPGLPPLSEALSGTAKDDYAAAHLLYDDGDYAGALVKYKSAYDASKDARLLWDAATCEKNLRHYAKAVTLVARYLAAGAPYVTLEGERNAQTFLDAVKPLTANTVVVSTEPDATISVDGEVVGTTPLTEALLVDIGSRQFSVQKDGFKPFSTTVNVTGSAQVRIDAALEKIVHQGRLVVRADPNDVIDLDGRGVGSGTWEATLPSGGHTVRVTAPDMHPFQQEVLIQDGQSRTVDVTLESVSKGVPTWVWIVGSAVLVAGAATGGYFLFKPSDTTGATTPGTMQPGTINLPFTR